MFVGFNIMLYVAYQFKSTKEEDIFVDINDPAHKLYMLGADKAKIITIEGFTVTKKENFSRREYQSELDRRKKERRDSFVGKELLF